MSLAAKLPYDHPYAGGYPGIGSQPLPTDADALDYLSRVKAADGAGVEVGVATAVSAFFRDTKATGVFSALKACCILAGARTLAGALVPVVGDAPTNVANGFVNGDFSRTAGLTGDGTSYIDSGRANDDDPQNDNHNAIYLSAIESGPDGIELGAGAGAGRNMINATVTNNVFTRCRDATEVNTGLSSVGSGVIGISRSDSSGYAVRSLGDEYSATAPADGVASENVFVFAASNAGSPFALSFATLSFYSIGTSLSLEDLDTAVTNLITAIGEAL